MEPSAPMTLIYFVFLCQFTVSLAYDPVVSTAFYQPALKLKVSPDGKGVVTAHLKSTHQILANGYLPVWTVNKGHPNTLQKEENVMQQVGPFILYQDSATTSAAVIFVEQQEMHGIVDGRTIIKKNQLDFKALLSSKVSLASGVNPRTQSRFFQTLEVESVPSTSGGSRDHRNRRSDEYLNEKTEVTRLRRDSASWNYIETLVIVNYDMVEELKTEPHNFSPIVSYVLGLFNNVDMLYAKIWDPKIIFNLAGVVLLNYRESSPLHEEGACNEQIENGGGRLEDNMNARCTNEFIKVFCDRHIKTIPRGTYDVAIILTRYGLHLHENNPRTGNKEVERLGGLADPPKDPYYDLMKMGTMPTLVATISDRGEHESFPVIAHAMAHLFAVGHDEPTNDQHRIMHPNVKHSQNSLSWSTASIERLKIFFESHHSCTFKNNPGSLTRPGPHKIWDANRQCRCYGFKSANYGIHGGFHNQCDENIVCVDKFGKTHRGPVYWDGTPSGEKTVCWAGEHAHIRK